MGKIKKFDEFQKERGNRKDEMYQTIQPTREIGKPSCCSDKLYETIQSLYEMAISEMKAFHEDEKKENTAKVFMKEFQSCMKSHSDRMLKECDTYMGK
jgi:hypothetical protein